MNKREMMDFVKWFLDGWNTQDVETVASMYADDVAYCDPNTGPLSGGEALRKYLKKLFAGWDMQWYMKEGFPLKDENGAAFLWRSELKKPGTDEVVELHGMDLVIFDGKKITRNEVYFDRTPLVPLMK